MGLPSYFGWIPNNTTNILTPAGGQLTNGWVAGQRPPNQYFNWFFNLVSQWVNRLGPLAPTVVVGSGANCTHASLAAAVADAGVGTNINVVLTESYLIGSIIHLTKAGWHIYAVPGITYTKNGVANGISCEANDIIIQGLRMANFSTAGDKAITGTSAWVYGRILFNTFSNCDTEVDDSSSPAGKQPIQLGNITEI